MLFLFHKYFVILRTETNKAKYMMKTRSLFTILFCCVAAVCVTSCINNDDDDNSSQALTKAEIAQCYMTVGGNYTGDLLYLTTSADDMTEDVDTLVGKWNIPTDSTLIITDFPSKVLAEYVSYPGLKEALAEAPDQVIKCRIQFVEKSPVQFLVNPYVLEYTLHYGDGDHQVRVAFYINNIYSFGTFDATSRELMLKIIPGALYVDGKETSYFTPSQIVFVAKKSNG